MATAEAKAQSFGGNLRDLGAIVIALTFVQAAVAAVGFAIPLLLRSAGASSFVIGLVTACYMAGFLIGARLAPNRISLIGHIRAFVLFAALATLSSLAFLANGSPLWTAMVELLLGFSVAGLFATGESWIADAAPESRRGRILSFYYLIAKIGTMAGPIILTAVLVTPESVFAIMAALFCCAIIPVAATRQREPAQHSSAPFGLRELWQTAPAGVQAAFIAGAVNGAVLQLYPLYMSATVPRGDVLAIAGFNAVAQVGALAIQWPSGSISDRFDRRTVIAWLAIVGAVASFAMAMLHDDPHVFLVLGLATIWGAGSLTYYAIAVAHTVDRAGDGMATKAIAGMLMVWATGAVIGPIAAGALMSALLGPSGLFFWSGCLLTLLAAAVLFRRVTASTVPTLEKEPFAPVSTTSVGIGDIDPRGQ